MNKKAYFKALSVLDLEVDVWFTRISAVPTLSDYSASADSISFLYAWAVRKEVCYYAVFMFAVANNDMVSSHIRSGAISLSLCNDWRIRKVAYHRNYNAICRSQNIFCITEVVL